MKAGPVCNYGYMAEIIMDRVLDKCALGAAFEGARDKRPTRKRCKRRSRRRHHGRRSGVDRAYQRIKLSKSTEVYCYGNKGVPARRYHGHVYTFGRTDIRQQQRLAGSVPSFIMKPIMRIEKPMTTRSSVNGAGEVRSRIARVILGVMIEK